MSNSATARMAAAVSNAGGLGSLGVGSYTPERAKTAISDYRQLSREPVNVNVFCHAEPNVDEGKAAAWLEGLRGEFTALQAEVPAQLTEVYKSFTVHKAMQQVVLDARPEVVSFHFGLPGRDVIAEFKLAGSFTVASVTNLAEAEAAVNEGIEAVVA